MSSTYVCSQCCRTTARRAVRLVRQQPCSSHPQLRRASSYHLDDLVSELPRSTRYSRPRPKPATTTPTRPESLYDYVAAKTTPQPARRPRNTPAPSNTVPDAQHASSSIHSSPRTNSKPDAHLVSYTSNLQELVSKKDANAAWSYFCAHYTAPDCSALDPACLPFIDVPKHKSRLVYTELLSLMTRHWIQQLESLGSPENIASPSPCDVLQAFDRLAISSPSITSSLAFSLAIHLQLAAAKGLDVLHDPTTKPVLVQLIELWPLCFFPRWETKDHKAFQSRCAALVRAPTQKPSGLVISLLLVQDLLCRAKSFPPDLEQYRLHLRALSRTTPFAQFSGAAVRHIEMRLKSESPDDALGSAQLTAKLCNLRSASVLVNVPANATLKDQNRPVAPETVEQKTKRLVAYVSHAADKQNLDNLERLWTEAQDLFADEESRTTDNAPSTLRLYEAFLSAFFQLRRPQSGLQVWNSMLNSGFEPTVRTWNIMMKSCHISRDINIMESMWQRMRNSGLQPDVVSWSTRIYGHLRVGDIREGMSALDEMGREWFASQNKRNPKSAATNITAEIPAPNIAILNTAVSALRGSRAHHIPNVLAWSRSFNIEADVDTYNMLLAVALNGGQAADAASILKRMAASNIEPNSSTFTILVNSMLSTTMLNDLTKVEQEAKIMGLISSFEECGLKVDVQGYALLIDRMLKEHENLAAAQSVLGHMMARGVQCTPHIYTILMTHYFDANPPALFAADALWNDIQKTKGHTLDVIFYDRMVEGFARHGDVGRTMAFLNRMSKEGKRPGWLAMMAVVQCLARNNEWDRVAQIVIDCHKQEGLLSVGLRGKKGQKDFWYYVGKLADNELYDSEHGKEIFAIVEAQREALGM